MNTDGKVVVEKSEDLKSIKVDEKTYSISDLAKNANVVSATVSGVDVSVSYDAELSSMVITAGEISFRDYNIILK